MVKGSNFGFGLRKYFVQQDSEQRIVVF